MAYKVFFIIYMKEIGEKLREGRKKNGVSLEEASNDLSINILELESLENGNFKAFKDVYELKKSIKAYSRYLGLSEKEIFDEFNDFLFEKTSKISLDDINMAKRMLVTEKKISSPYTNIKPSRYNFAPIVLAIILLFFISLIVYLGLNFIKKDKVIDRELQGNMEVIYEFAK